MKRKKTWLYVCLTLLMLALTPAAVYGEEPDGIRRTRPLPPISLYRTPDRRQTSSP